MTTELDQVLQLQFHHVRQLNGKHRLAALPRLLEFVYREPRLCAIATELLETANVAIGQMESLDQTLRTDLSRLWIEHSQWFLSSWDEACAADPANPAFKAYGSPYELAEALQQDNDWQYPDHEEPDASVVLNGVGRFFPKISHWLGCLPSRGKRVAELECAYATLLSRHREGIRRYILEGMAAPGVALHRLTQTARGLVPRADRTPVATEMELLQKACVDIAQGQLADTVVDLGTVPDRLKVSIARFDAQVGRDLALLESELRKELGMERSYTTLVNRFKAWCETYEAERIREDAESRPGRIEARLTIELSRFLFDHGLNPLIDSKVSGLRPDLLDEAAGLYVEVKQYGDESDSAVRRKIEEAVTQVWNTWGRLDARRAIPSAYLVIFRRGGPDILLPTLLTAGGRRLHIIKIDIAPAAESGSKLSRPTLVFGDDALAPQKVES